jgi:hypothetical protein
VILVPTRDGIWKPGTPHRLMTPAEPTWLAITSIHDPIYRKELAVGCGKREFEAVSCRLPWGFLASFSSYSSMPKTLC